MHVATPFRAALGRSLLVCMVMGLAIGCDDDDDGDRDATVAPGDGGGGSADATVGADGAVVGTLTEAEVAGVVNMIHTSEIALAGSVADRLVDDDIEALSAMVVAGHTASAADHAALIERLGITPVESALSGQIEQQAALIMEDLAPLAGAELDAAYLEAQIIFDAEMLDDLQTELAPSTTTRQYREYLFEMREVLVADLQAGRALGGDTTAAEPEEPEPEAP